MNLVRRLVSKRKKRTIDASAPCGSIDLDLVEIHPRIVCMGYPASGIESLYRNRYKDVLRYLDYRYGASYIVYNLCAEKAYQYSPQRFHGKVKLFPFLDHQACPLDLIPTFVADAMAHLRRHPDNVVVIHCKAGKGRTGILACCLLMKLDPQLYFDAESAIRFYGAMRTSDGKGLTVPSQRRYVHYYEMLLRDYGGHSPHPVAGVRLREIRLVGFPSSLSLRRLCLTINNAVKPVIISITRSQCVQNAPARCKHSERDYTEDNSSDNYPVLVVNCTSDSQLRLVSGDVRVELYTATRLVGSLSFHTLFMKKHYAASEIDMLCRRMPYTDICGIDFLFDQIEAIK